MADKLLGRKGNDALEQLTAVKGSLDAKDPLYDSETEDNCYFESYRPAERRPSPSTQSTYSRPARPSRLQDSQPVTYPEFLQVVTQRILPDGFRLESNSEVCAALKDLDCYQFHDAFVAKAISMSLDFDLSKQKWIGQLLTMLFDCHLLSRAAANKGFEKLVQQCEDIKLDVPDVHFHLFSFMKWAVADGVLDASFILRLPETYLKGLLPTANRLALENEELVELQHHLQKLHAYKAAIRNQMTHIFWNTNSGEDLELLLVDEAHPEFKHEVVRSLITISMGLTDVEREVTSTLLSNRFGSDDTQFSSDDILVGFIRVIGEIDDIKIDIPYATTLLSKFLVRAVVDEIIPPIFILDCIRLGIGGESGKCCARAVKQWVLEEKNGVMDVTKFHKIWAPVNPCCPDTRIFRDKARDLLRQHYADRDVALTLEALNSMGISLAESVLFVRLAIDVAIEKDESARQSCVPLLNELLVKRYVEPQAIREGFQLERDHLPNLMIDVPFAAIHLRKIVKNAKIAHVLPDDFVLRL